MEAYGIVTWVVVAKFMRYNLYYVVTWQFSPVNI